MRASSCILSRSLSLSLSLFLYLFSLSLSLSTLIPFFFASLPSSLLPFNNYSLSLLPSFVIIIYASLVAPPSPAPPPTAGLPR